MGNEKRVEAMRKLGMTEEEIADVLKCDAEIDHGENLFELTAEQKKAEKKARMTGQKKKAPTVYNLQKRDRKTDNDKREIMQCIDDALCCLVDDVEVINPERELEFFYNDKRYRIILSAPYKKKG